MRIKRKGYTLNIFEDDIESPRDYFKDDNITHMICFHRRLNLGDEHDYKSLKEFKEWYNENKDKLACIKPLYLYDHSGLDISTTPYNDPWDSGQVGYVYVDKKEASLKGYEDITEITNKLEDEVFEYDQWLSEAVQYYSFEITDENDNLLCSRGVYSGADGNEVMINKMKNDIDNEYRFLFDEILKKSENYL